MDFTNFDTLDKGKEFCEAALNSCVVYTINGEAKVKPPKSEQLYEVIGYTLVVHIKRPSDEGEESGALLATNIRNPGYLFAAIETLMSGVKEIVMSMLFGGYGEGKPN